MIRCHAQRMALALHERPDARDTYAEYKGHPGHAFVTNHADFEGPVSVDRRKKRNQTVEREVNKPDGLPRLVENLPKFQYSRFEFGPQALIMPRRNACQHEVRNGSWIAHSLITQKESKL